MKAPYYVAGVYVEITSICNLRCIHCYNDSGKEKNEISVEAFQNILEAYNNTEFSLAISGGEPLLHPKFWELVKLAKEKGISDILIITNGTQITEDIAKKLAEYDISVQISLNGINAETHDQICGKGAFEKTIKGIEYLINAGHKDIVIRSMIAKCNKTQLLEFIDTMSKKNISTISFGNISVQGRGVDNKDSLCMSTEENEKILEMLRENEITKAAEEKGIRIDIPGASYNSGCPILHPSEKEIPITPRIDAKGNVYLCQSFEGEVYSFGNVYDSKLTDIMDSLAFDNFIKFCQMSLCYMQDCNSCVWQNVCGRGCIAEAASRGALQFTDGHCEYRNKQYADKLIKERSWN